MKTYERETIGSIVIIKNIIFENPLNHKKEIDHAYKYGRPCFIIYSDEEYDYFLTMTSNAKREQYTKQNFSLNKLNKDSFIYRERNFIKDEKEISLINLQHIYKIPISGHNEIGKVTFETYKNIINKLKKYYKNENINEIIEKSQIVRGRRL